MKRPVLFLLPLVIFSLAVMLVLSSCSAKKQTTGGGGEPLAKIKSIVVLPVEMQRSDRGYDAVTTRQLETGINAINSLLQDMLADNQKVIFLTENRMESMLTNSQGNSLATARYLGQQLGVDAVMVTQISRFLERDGGEYSANEPASVAFKIQLIQVSTGATLCLGVFDETQQPLLANLFSFGKASRRGFKWITAEQLAREGLHEKLSDCQYLTE